MWKRSLIISISLLILLLVSVSGVWVEIGSYTFDGGSNEGFTKLCGDNADFSNNDYRESTSTNGATYGLDLDLQPDQKIYNISFSFESNTDYIQVGIDEGTISSCASFYGVRVHDGNDQVQFIKTDGNIQKTEAKVMIAGYKYYFDLIYYPNGTMLGYFNDTLLIQDDTTENLTSDYQYLVLFSRNQQEHIDDVYIQYWDDEPEVPTITYPSIVKDINITGINEHWVNWTNKGNYTTVVGYLDGSIIFNSSITEYNFTGLTNNTQYFINLSIIFNETVYNNTYYNFTTLQYFVSLADIWGKLVDIEEDVADVDDIWEEINMIWLIGAWLFIYAGAIWLMLNSNFMIGAILWYWNYSFDFFVITELFNRYSAARVGTAFYTTAYGLFFVGLLVWCVIKFLIPFMIRKPMRG